MTRRKVLAVIAVVGLVAALVAYQGGVGATAVSVRDGFRTGDSAIDAAQIQSTKQKISALSHQQQRAQETRVQLEGLPASPQRDALGAKLGNNLAAIEVSLEAERCTLEMLLGKSIDEMRSAMSEDECQTAIRSNAQLAELIQASGELRAVSKPDTRKVTVSKFPVAPTPEMLNALFAKLFDALKTGDLAGIKSAFTAKQRVNVTKLWRETTASDLEKRTKDGTGLVARPSVDHLGSYDVLLNDALLTRIVVGENGGFQLDYVW